VGRIHTVVEVVHNCRHTVVGRRRVADSSWLCWIYRILSVTRLSQPAIPKKNVLKQGFYIYIYELRVIKAPTCGRWTL